MLIFLSSKFRERFHRFNVKILAFVMNENHRERKRPSVQEIKLPKRRIRINLRARKRDV